MVTGSFIWSRIKEKGKTEKSLGITSATHEICFEVLMPSVMAWRKTHLVHFRILFLFLSDTDPSPASNLREKNIPLNRARKGIRFGSAYHFGQFGQFDQFGNSGHFDHFGHFGHLNRAAPKRCFTQNTSSADLNSVGHGYFQEKQKKRRLLN